MQFDRATANVYKSNAYIQFEKIIYLDRYADDNFEELKHRRSQVATWRTELEKCKKQVKKYTTSDVKATMKTINVPYSLIFIVLPTSYS